MLKLIKERIEIVVALIAGTGSGLGLGLTDIIEAPEIRKRLIAIAFASSLLFSFLISSYLKRSALKNKVKRAWKIFYFSVAAFLVFAFSFLFFSDRQTVSWKVENDKREVVDTTIMIKGLYYAEPAKRYIAEETKKNHFRPSDEQVLEYFTYETSYVWNRTSITLARLLILLLYILMMAGFVGGITSITEILMIRKRRTKPKD